MLYDSPIALSNGSRIINGIIIIYIYIGVW